MKEPVYISREAPAHTSKDFARLLDEGIRLVQQLGGDVWTDYNAHDPGVTILEQLCYALTDLGYRTDYAVEDILAHRPDEAEHAPPHTLYTGDKILPCSPLVDLDYRKLLWDRVTGLKNAWLVSVDEHGVPVTEAADHLGLYTVMVEVSEAVKDEKERIVYEVRRLLRAHRTLAEDIHAVEILRPAPITVAAEVEIDYQFSPESILARILFNLQVNLVPIPLLYTVDRLMQAGISPDRIFTGPPLVAGVYDDRHFAPLPREVKISRIESIIREVDGVNKILDVRAYLSEAPEATAGPVIHLQEKAVPRIKPNRFNRAADAADVFSEQDAYDIKLIRGGREHPIDPGRVVRKIQLLLLEHRREYLFARKDMRHEAYRRLPRGTYKDIAAYHSIQHHFPLTYGLGPYGIPDAFYGVHDAPSEAMGGASATVSRQAQARQLKAYLLFFEQLLANYLAQLAHVDHFFSLDSDLDRTYFAQPITNVPNVSPILRRPDVGTRGGGTPRPVASYESRLDHLVLRSDDFLDRRNRLLDHLLARFNEHFEDSLLDDFDVRPSGDKDDFHHELIRWKIEFLRQYLDVSNGRGVGFDDGTPASAVFIVDRDPAAKIRFHAYLTAGEQDERLRDILHYGRDPANYKTETLVEGEVRLVLYAMDATPPAVLAYGVACYAPDLSDTSARALKESLAAFVRTAGGTDEAVPEARLREAREAGAVYLWPPAGTAPSDWPQSSGLERRVRWLLGTGGHVQTDPGTGRRVFKPASPRLVPPEDARAFTYTDTYVTVKVRVEMSEEARGAPAGARYDTVESFIPADEEARDLLNTEGAFVFSSDDPALLREILDFGTVRTNYKIVRTSEGVFRVLFDTPGHLHVNERKLESNIEVYRTDTLEDAEAALEAFIAYLADFRGDAHQLYQGEGFYIVEHILLRPVAPSTSFGLQVVDVDRHGEVMLRSDYLDDEDARRRRAAEILRCGGAPDNYETETLPRGGARWVLYTERRQGSPRVALAYGERAFVPDPEEEAVRPDALVARLRKIAGDEEAISDRHVDDAIEAGHIRFLPVEQPSGPTAGRPESASFAPFTVSVFFPNWPARFQDTDFRLFAEGVVRENTPAHVTARFFWLNMPAMQVFEKRYRAWVEARASVHRGSGRVNRVAGALKTFIAWQEIRAVWEKAEETWAYDKALAKQAEHTRAEAWKTTRLLWQEHPPHAAAAPEAFGRVAQRIDALAHQIDAVAREVHEGHVARQIDRVKGQIDALVHTLGRFIGQQETEAPWETDASWEAAVTQWNEALAVWNEALAVWETVRVRSKEPGGVWDEALEIWEEAGAVWEGTLAMSASDADALAVFVRQVEAWEQTLTVLLRRLAALPRQIEDASAAQVASFAETLQALIERRENQ